MARKLTLDGAKVVIDYAVLKTAQQDGKGCWERLTKVPKGHGEHKRKVVKYFILLTPTPHHVYDREFSDIYAFACIKHPHDIQKSVAGHIVSQVVRITAVVGASQVADVSIDGGMYGGSTNALSHHQLRLAQRTGNESDLWTWARTKAENFWLASGLARIGYHRAGEVSVRLFYYHPTWWKNHFPTEPGGIAYPAKQFRRHDSDVVRVAPAAHLFDE